MFRELLLGCGRSRDKRMYPVHNLPKNNLEVTEPVIYREWQNLFTLDRSRVFDVDLICDLDKSYWWPTSWSNKAIPHIRDVGHGTWALESNLFDEIHAYEVLEHLGAQGFAPDFFAHFTQIWEWLKPDGFLCATVPSRFSPWLWGDPSHRRVIYPESLGFLDQDNYKQCDGPKPSPMSDFRDLYKADFQICERQDNNHAFAFILQAVKPSRWTEPTP